VDFSIEKWGYEMIRMGEFGEFGEWLCVAIYGYLWLSDFHNLLGFELLSQTWDEFRSDSHLLDQMFPTTVRSCCISISEFLDQCGNPPRFGMIISNSMQLI